MNERLRELAYLAGFSSWELSPSKETMSDTPQKVGKLMDLVVLEVISELDKIRKDYATALYGSIELLKSQEAKEYAIESAIDDLKYKFGVSK